METKCLTEDVVYSARCVSFVINVLYQKAVQCTSKCIILKKMYHTVKHVSILCMN